MGRIDRMKSYFHILFTLKILSSCQFNDDTYFFLPSFLRVFVVSSLRIP